MKRSYVSQHEEAATRLRFTVVAAIALLVLSACAGDAESEPAESTSTSTPTSTVTETTTTTMEPLGTGTVVDATEFLDGWVAAWIAGDEEAVAAAFIPDAVLIGPFGTLVGEDAGAHMAGFVPTLPELKRTSDGVDNGDGSFAFDVEWVGPAKTEKLALDIATTDGTLVWMKERFR